VSTAGDESRYVVFEGLDGVGKTTFVTALAGYYRQTQPHTPLYAGRVSGVMAGSLGGWIYHLRHGRAVGVSWHDGGSEFLDPEHVSPLMIELLHMTAHVETIVRDIEPTLRAGGTVILDRYWWSIYAFLRPTLSVDDAMSCVAPELVFWRRLPVPTVIYLARHRGRLEASVHAEIDGYYRELIAQDRDASIHVVDNDGPLAATWAAVLAVLGLSFRPMTADGSHAGVV
jgi:thymidylate kinase